MFLLKIAAFLLKMAAFLLILSYLLLYLLPSELYHSFVPFSSVYCLCVCSYSSAAGIKHQQREREREKTGKRGDARRGEMGKAPKRRRQARRGDSPPELWWSSGVPQLIRSMESGEWREESGELPEESVECRVRVCMYSNNTYFSSDTDRK